jgi:hypothetical protein
VLDIRRALEFVFEDEQARLKIAGGLLWLLVPIANIVVIGYEVEVVRRVAQGEERPLPTWDNLGQLFVVGARLSLARFIYGLPVLAAVASGVLAGLALALQAPQSPDQAFWQTAGPFILLGVFCLLGGVFVYALGTGFLSPAVLGEYAQRGTFGACFDFAAIWRFIWRAPGLYLKLWLADAVIALGVGLLGSIVGIITSAIPCVGSLVILLVSSATALFILLVNGHLVGQLLRASYPSPIKES